MRDIANPKIGIFWYDRDRDRLFGVAKMREVEVIADALGKRTFPILHVHVWEEMRNRYYDRFGNFVADEIYPSEDGCPYAESDYTQIPRGRIFSDDRGYQIYVGSWIHDDGIDVEHVIEMIKDEFDLPDDEAEIIEMYHWDIGNGWGE